MRIIALILLTVFATIARAAYPQGLIDLHGPHIMGNSNAIAALDARATLITNGLVIYINGKTNFAGLIVTNGIQQPFISMPETTLDFQTNQHITQVITTNTTYSLANVVNGKRYKLNVFSTNSSTFTFAAIVQCGPTNTFGGSNGLYFVEIEYDGVTTNADVTFRDFTAGLGATPQGDGKELQLVERPANGTFWVSDDSTPNGWRAVSTNDAVSTVMALSNNIIALHGPQIAALSNKLDNVPTFTNNVAVGNATSLEFTNGANTTVRARQNGGRTVYFIDGAAGGGTNALSQTNGVDVGSFGTINFIDGGNITWTGAVDGAVFRIGAVSAGGGITVAEGTNIVAVTNGSIITINAIPFPKGPAGGDLSGTYPNPTVVKASTTFQFSGQAFATPSGQQDDYNPTGWSTKNGILIAPSGDLDITGLAGGLAGRVAFLVNVSATDTITLKHEDTDSTAGNRFNLGTDVAISPGETCFLIYDATVNNRWNRVGTLADTGVTPGTYTSVTVDRRGRVTSGSSPAAGAPAISVNTNGVVGATNVQQLAFTNSSQVRVFVVSNDTGVAEVSFDLLPTTFAGYNISDSIGNLQTAVGGVNILVSTELDTSSELAGLLDNETGDGSVVFSNAPTISGATLLGITTASTLSNVTAIKYSTFKPGITASNLVLSFSTNVYECWGLTNIVLTNIVEELHGTAQASIKIYVFNTNGVNCSLSWPTYGAQQGYFFRTNLYNPVLAWPAVTNAKTAVISLDCIGTNIFAAITEWP